MALAALAIAPSALANGEKFTVAGGRVHQTVTWFSDSSSDDGCYTSYYASQGKTEVTLKPKVGTTVTVKGPQDMVYGLEFSGTETSSAEYHRTPQKDANAPNDCPPATAPQYKPPSTAGCGTTHLSRDEIGMYVLPLSHERLIYDPHGNLGLGGSWNDHVYDCPDEDLYASSTIPAPSKKYDKSDYRDKKLDFDVSEPDPTKKALRYEGPDNHGGSQTAKIRYTLQLVRKR